jgi:hypothetical protein
LRHKPYTARVHERTLMHVLIVFRHADTGLTRSYTNAALHLCY